MALLNWKAGFAGGALLLASVMPLAPAAQAQRRHDNYYGGMHNSVRGGDYDRRYGRDDRHGRDHGGGIGPGYGALIGAGGGAVLGAAFGGGIKGALLGGAAGAGLGALGGELAQGNDHGRHHRR